MPLTSKTHSLVYMRNESTSNMTTLFACAYGVTSLFPSKFQFQEHVAFQLVTVIFWPSAGSSSLFSKVQDKYWRMVVQSTQWKDSFGKNCWILAKCGSPPLGLKKIADPPGDSFAYYYRPPWPKARGGSGICKLMQPLPEAEGHANLWLVYHKFSRKYAKFALKNTG